MSKCRGGITFGQAKRKSSTLHSGKRKEHRTWLRTGTSPGKLASNVRSTVTASQASPIRDININPIYPWSHLQ